MTLYGLFRHRRVGIRARLWVAFLVVASMTVVASVVAWINSESSGRMMATMVKNDIPTLMALSTLNQRITQLVATAPNIVFINSQREMSEQIRRTMEADGALAEAVNAVRDRVGDSADLDNITLTATRAGVQLQILLSAIKQSIGLKHRYVALADQLDVLQREYRSLVEVKSGWTPTDVRMLNALDQAIAILESAWQARSAPQMQEQRQRLLALLDGIEAVHKQRWNDVQGEQDFAPFFDRVRQLAMGEENIFNLKSRDLQAHDVAAKRLETLRPLALQLHEYLRAVTTISQSHIQQGYRQIEETFAHSEVILALSSLCSLLVAGVVAWRYVGVSLIGRLNRLATSMQAIATGNLVATIPTDGNDEVSDMAQTLVVFRDALARVKHIATHDTLTGLANRHLVVERLTALMDQKESCGAVIFINLRGFKDINYTFGHTVGDQILVAFADRLRQMSRSADLAGRLGGDDFTLVVPGLASDRDIEACLCDLEPVLAAPVPLDMVEIEVQSSLGIARYPADGQTAEGILRCAEMAIQRASSSPRTVAYYATEMGQSVLHRKAVLSDLRKGIASGQLELLYQPKIDMRTGRVGGMEGLVRWNHPERGRISPLDFIPLAEQSGLILPLGEWVLYEGCRQAQAWRNSRLGDLRVALNMSPVQIFPNDALALVRDALQQTGLPPHLLEIEITEGVMIEKEARVLQQLRALRDLGVHLAIDDFGTGYSSLSYLRALPVTALKIDRSFVRNVTANPEDARLNKMIISMAHGFGLEVVAEGIEMSDHALFLRGEGCDLGQGYFYARPLDVAGFEILLKATPHWLDVHAHPFGKPHTFSPHAGSQVAS